MSLTKIHLSQEELRLVNDKQWILTKNNIIKKIMHLLSDLEQVQKDILDRSTSIPAEVRKVSSKISKGENYKGLPWLVLDHPRWFEQDNYFAIRTMFWWGTFFSTTLQISGRYKSEFGQKLLERLKKDETGFMLCINDDPWHHHFERDNFIALEEIDKELWKIISSRSFIKIGKTIAIGDPVETIRLLSEDYAALVKLLGD